MRVLVVTGRDLVADVGLLQEVAAAEFAALGVEGRFVAAADVTTFQAELGGAGDGCAVVALPGPCPATRRLAGAESPSSSRVVWLDLAREGTLTVAAGATHLQGRGCVGLVWAIRHAVHRSRRPARRVSYGAYADQWGELRLPPSAGGSPLRAAVLIHGGYWRSIWGADLMDGLAIDLADRGYASWNLEYRRPDLHGWDATTDDVAAGIEALETLEAPLDLGRVVVIGHSAGAQLALRAAADTGRVALAVSLAGVLDLVEGDRRRIGSDAVKDALGGTVRQMPEVYAASSPFDRLPMGVPQLVVQGTDDDLDLVDMSRRYARAAADEAVYLERPGDHFAVIDPAAPIWKATARELESWASRVTS
ncbi:alpha/beta hydrolase fold domain-containing protein [Sphaerisporangium flaviroseum]|uniref:Alpha/beta hydrolase fold domain-containing protein n=1 Tax=Sphaerisporangium flaviroseum TaxID=509199 RepID=A0ABP7JJC8_9ACTN